MPETNIIANVVIDALLDPHFILGFVAGCIVLAIGVLATPRASSERIAGYGGTLLAIGVVGALLLANSTSIWIIPGVVALGLAGVLHRGLLAGMAFAAPGALLMVVATPGDMTSWMRWFAFAAIVVTGPLVAAFDHQDGGRGLPLPLFAVSTLGLYLTVPDTESGLVLLGAASVVGFLGWPKPIATLGSVGSFAMAGVYASVALSGAGGRPASLIAVEACLGLLIAAPIWWKYRANHSSGFLAHYDTTAIILGQAVVVLTVSRVFGRFSNPWLTALTVGAVLLATMLGLGALDRRSVPTGSEPTTDRTQEG